MDNTRTKKFPGNTFNGYPTPQDSQRTNRFRESSQVDDRSIPFNIKDHFQPKIHKPKRFTKVLRENLLAAINKPTIRRLARRGGVKRIQSTIYDTVQQVVRARLEEILHHTVAICESRGRKTVNTLDVVYALRVLGNPIYGFGSIVHGDEVKSGAEYMRKRRAGFAENRRNAQRALEREQENQRIDEQVRRMGGSVNVRYR